MQKPFICHEPRIQSSPVIFNSPHSGRRYSQDFLAQSILPLNSLRLSEDFYVDALLDTANDCGSILLEASFPRSYVDVNRAPTELDQSLISSLKASSTNAKTIAGLGVVPRVVGNGLEIYRTKISLLEVNFRLNNYYFPYHEKLKQLIDSTVTSFGFAILFDFHSMPHSCINFGGQNKLSLPQVILSDCFGTSCNDVLSEKVFDIFSTEGFNVEMNNPFSGGFITKNYGQPKENVQVIQVEIDRSLYIDEINYTFHSGYVDLKKKIRNVVYALSMLQEHKSTIFQAAE